VSRYLIILEPTEAGFSAYSPDLPGCVSTGVTREDVEAKIREAIEFHLDGLREEGQPVPPPHAVATYVEVAA
jgi:predicted RNase H-like HicB family nuclease